jgi:hypothetical protein
MSQHEEFFQYLDGLPGGNAAKAALLDYKANADEIAFKVNGYLRGCVPSNEYADFVKQLAGGILAQNTSAFTVYRMTTVDEFSVPLLPFHLNNDDFPYLAFMSTSGSPQNLHTFVQNEGTPLLLEIECPAMTTMALMEGGDLGLEDEYLLGCRTRFQLLGVDHFTEAEKFEIVEWNAPHKQMFKARLRVAGNPKYTQGKETFQFDPSAADGEGE